MNFIQFLFQLLHRFNLLGDDYAKTKQEADLWYADIRADKEALEGKLIESDKKFPMVLRKAKYYLEQWYGKVGLAILFILAVRYIHQYMNPEQDQEREREER